MGDELYVKGMNSVSCILAPERPFYYLTTATKNGVYHGTSGRKEETERQGSCSLVQFPSAGSGQCVRPKAGIWKFNPGLLCRWQEFYHVSHPTTSQHRQKASQQPEYGIESRYSDIR